MNLVTTVTDLFLTVAIVACCYYVIVRKRRKRWPVTDALIQRGAVGEINLGQAGGTHAVFMGYSFQVNDLRYAGYFVLLGSEARVHDLHRRLPGTPVQVRYDPSDPSKSFLVNYQDARFEGLVASQAASLLADAPAFDLQDAMRK
jgi:hypothetical protein